MKYISCMIVILIFLFNINSYATDKGKSLKEAEALLNAMRAMDAYKQTVDRFSERFPEYSTALNNEAAKRRLFELIYKEMVQIYSEVYTDEELVGIRKFFQSNAGKAFLDKKPLLTKKYMDALGRILGKWKEELITKEGETKKP